MWSDEQEVGVEEKEEQDEITDHDADLSQKPRGRMAVLYVCHTHCRV